MTVMVLNLVLNKLYERKITFSNVDLTTQLTNYNFGQ